MYVFNTTHLLQEKLSHRSYAPMEVGKKAFPFISSLLLPGTNSWEWLDGRRRLLSNPLPASKGVVSLYSCS